VNDNTSVGMKTEKVKRNKNFRIQGYTYTGRKYPHIRTLSFSTDKNQNTEV